MHVGHLRTTVVGDALARTLEQLGHHVIRQNHIGDWGTPFGMLIEHLLDVGEDSDEADLLVTDPNAFYQAARVKFDGRQGRPFAATPTSGPHPGRQAPGRRPRHPGPWARARRPVEDLLQQDLLDAGHHADRRRPRRRVAPTTTVLADLCAELEAKGIATVSRRRPVRLPRRLHRARGQAGAAHHPQERRRLQLRHDRPGDDQAPRRGPQGAPGALRRRRPAGPAPQHGVGHRAQGRLAARRRRARPRPDRQRARRRPQDPQDALRQAAAAHGPARRGRREGPDRHRRARGPTSTRPCAPPSPGRSASAP